ncbi:uncharacterized protein LOC124812446 isoform X1 [Hydra vulgaris]|uniref:uncharacterized protein LOC124812446 isoform X1 n=1 Tax=Hydra vulgaris TaxID=6087 RepID=UPI0032E9D532
MSKKTFLSLSTSPQPSSTTSHLKPFSSKTNISDVFMLTKDSVIPRIVEDAALHTIKQMMAKNDDNIVTFRSGGPRPNSFLPVSKAYVCSNKASIKTKKCRNSLLKNQLQIIAGKYVDAVGCQSSQLLKSFQPETRELILANSNINRVTIGAAEMVAIKADLSLPWEKLKTISKWLKTFDIGIASHASQRVIFDRLSGDDIIVESAPFAFQKEKKGTFEIKLASWGYIENLPANIQDILKN